MFELWHLFIAGVLYLGLLFFIAYAAERRWIPDSVARHPLTYTLSLGVYASSWSFYGSVGFADTQGYNFLTIYLGVTLAFLLAPVLLRPILRLVNEYQLSSLADLFAFRYQSQLAGVLVTLFMLAGTLPYIALQIRAVTESLQVLTQDSAPALIALVFCLTIILFAVLFGARHISAREKHEGLVVAIAFESVVKLAALLTAGLFALFTVFGGLGELHSWLAARPEALESLYRPVREGPWSTLLLLAFAAAFLLPRQFHMAFTENLEPRAQGAAYWAFPLFLLLLNLPIPIILWAGKTVVPTMSPDYYVLGIAKYSGSVVLPVVTFLGGLSAASAMVIVTSLALAAMTMNHLVLPASFPPRVKPHRNIYSWLLWGRRTIIALIILAGYGFYLLLERNQGLVQLGLISFVAVAQFLPGVAGLLYWRQATRTGFIAGLLGGMAVWAVTLLLPLLRTAGVFGITTEPAGGIASGDPWSTATFWSLSVNALLFTTGSLLTRPSSRETEAANACCKDTLTPPHGVLLAESPDQMREHLARIVGSDMAGHELKRALDDLMMTPHDRRPTQLRQLRDRIERNLSGLVGPVLARLVVDERLQMDPQASLAVADSVRFIEQRLEDSRTRLRGLAAELDSLRRYHRQVLEDLPLGVCSLGPNKEIVSWNYAMARLSGLERKSVESMPLVNLPEPWSGLLSGFLTGKEHHLRKVRVREGVNTRVFNLHKAAIENRGGTGLGAGGGMVILVEDLTDLYTLEAELAHSERLASVGRLAAGVAHEIGNPVTGIASLVQNLMFERDSDLLEEGLDQILEQTRRISNIVHSLITFSHNGTAVDHTPQNIPIRQCVEEAVRLVRLSHSAKQLQFMNRCDLELVVFGDHQRLVQVFVNLLSNASDASMPGDRVEIGCRLNGDFLEIELRDFGEGIEPDMMDRVFEPFVTTKEPGKGTGLGLPMVYNIIREHSGSITLDSTPGSGTRVLIKLPATLDDIERHRTDGELSSA